MMIRTKASSVRIIGRLIGASVAEWYASGFPIARRNDSEPLRNGASCVLRRTAVLGLLVSRETKFAY
jgi:hypothetical protein